jgi:hypothetical protein
MSENSPQLEFKVKFKDFAAYLFIKALYSTLSLSVRGWKNVPDAAVFALWHGEQLIMPEFYYRYLRNRERGLVALASFHADGQFAARIVRRFGIKIVSGSSSKGGVTAVRELLKESKNNYILMTVDGPKGPPLKVKRGIIFICEQTKLPIVAVKLKYSAAWSLKSWDSFKIPKPFSKVEVSLKVLNQEDSTMETLARIMEEPFYDESINER